MLTIRYSGGYLLSEDEVPAKGKRVQYLLLLLTLAFVLRFGETLGNGHPYETWASLAAGILCLVIAVEWTRIKRKWPWSRIAELNRKVEELNRLNTNLSAVTEANGQRLGVQLFQGRNDNRPPLRELIPSSREVWVATHVAGAICNDDLIKSPIKRLILQNPGSAMVDLLSGVDLQRSADQIRKQIELSIEQARKHQLELTQFDGPLTSLIIGNPYDADGWAQIEVYFPLCKSDNRPSILFARKQYPDLFATLIESFNEMAKRPSMPVRIVNEQFIEQMAGEYDKKRKADLDSKDKELRVCLISLEEAMKDLGRQKLYDLGCKTQIIPHAWNVQVKYFDLEDTELAEKIGNIFKDALWKHSLTPVTEYVPRVPTGKPRILLTAIEDKHREEAIKIVGIFHDAQFIKEPGGIVLGAKAPTSVDADTDFCVEIFLNKKD